MQAPVAPLFEVRGWFEFVGAVAAAAGTVLTVLWFILKPRLEQFVVDTHRTRAADIKVIEGVSWAKEIANQEAVYHLAQRTAADLATHSQSFENLKRELHRHLPVLVTLPNVLMSLERTIEKMDETMRDVREDLQANRTNVAVLASRVDILHGRHP